MARYTYVLIHGMWHGGWCWRYLVPLLTAEGHDVVTPTLTGLGDRAYLLHPDINLATHVTDVAAVLEMEDLTDVILVGHSYAGMVITGVAERCADRIRRLVYLDALVPGHGQSGFDINSDDFRAALEADARENGEDYKLTQRIPEALGITDPADAAWVASKLVPHPIGTFRDPVEAKDRVPAMPSTFIFCTQYAFGETAQNCKDKGWPVLEIDSGHDVMVTKPKELAAILLSPDCQ
jgi:pimeloyl-ACP methyl ester carboxylesterase